jgi:hypothetical protein
MVRRGYATVLTNGEAEYGTLESRSRQNRIGIWASVFELPAAYRAANPRDPGRARIVPTARRSMPTRSYAKPSSGYRYYTCAQARAAGAAPMYRGKPDYNPNLDDDGIACEPYRGR